MANFLIVFFTIVLVLASLFMIFLVLLQRGSDGGGGSAFGGGAAESAFGGETNRVLTRATVVTAILFFVVGLGLYLGQIAAHKKQHDKGVALDAIVARADAGSQAMQKAIKADEQPRPGEETKKAMTILAAETKGGATVAEVKPAVEDSHKEAAPVIAATKSK